MDEMASSEDREDATAPQELTPREAAVRLRVSDRTIRRWLCDGRLEGVRVGGRLRVDPEALERFARSAAHNGGTS